MSSKSIREEFPLHWLVWHNEFSELDKELAKEVHNKEKHDPRGRTPLHLAITLGHLESTRALLQHGANANAENKGYWSVLHEAVSTGDPELVQIVLKHRDQQRYNSRSVGVPELLQKLKEVPLKALVEGPNKYSVVIAATTLDNVPLVSRMCPSDTYRVYKSGSSVRIDTTLLGFDTTSWQRGSRSYIFSGAENSATVMEIDHDQREVFTETMQLQLISPDISILRPTDDAIAARLTNPIVTTYIDTEKICFERSKSGIWGWRSDKAETVNGHDTKVFSAFNVEVVTKTRVEHLSEQDREKSRKNSKSPLESFLGVAEEHNKAHGASNGDLSSMSNNPSSIKPEEYFNKHFDLGNRDIGRPIEQTVKTQKFKATLWLCETFPLSLQEQVVPIIDLMASSNAHFKKLKDFITLQLPAGFPVKIEIPLFHVLNAKITFGNIFAMDQPIEGVRPIKGTDINACVIDDSCFDAPPGYRVLGDGHHERLRDEADELLQFAIQQSLLDAGTENEQVTFYEALSRARPAINSRLKQEERLIQQAIADSIAIQSGKDIEQLPEIQRMPGMVMDEEEQLRMAIALSEQEERRRKDEDEELQRILQLSLTEK